MPVELRKRSAPEPAPPAAKRGKVDKSKKPTSKPKVQSPAPPEPPADPSSEEKSAKKSTNPQLSASSIGQKFTSSTPLTTHKSDQTTISDLLAKSDKGIVIFTYPRASTPGCTTQACSFNDNYDDIKAKGYEVYGMSMDSVKANTNFATKKGFGYLLLCDDGSVVKELGLWKAGKVARGVVVLDKEGVVKVWEQGGPARTLEVVKEELGL